MSQPRMICSNCEYRAEPDRFRGGDAVLRCPRCDSRAIHRADREPATFGGLTGAQWELVHDLAERQLNSGVPLVAQLEELRTIVDVAAAHALPAVEIIDELGVFGYLEEALASQSEDTDMDPAQEEEPEDRMGPEWADLREAVEQLSRRERESLLELLDVLQEALAERDAVLMASIAVAAGMGGELGQPPETLGDSEDPDP